MSKRPIIYLETSFVSMLFLRGRDVGNVARHMLSREWWEDEARHFNLCSSKITEVELAQGDYPWQEKALACVRRLRYLPRTAEVESSARDLLQAGIVPAGKSGDAAHLALAVFHEVDYLMSWNHAHLLNVQAQERLRELCVRREWRCPWLVSPESIPKRKFGQVIERR